MDIQKLQKLAEQGDAKAQYELGLIYTVGRIGEIEQDNYEAIKYLTMSSENGYANASFTLGRIHDNIYDEYYDPKEAVKWYKKAVEQSGNKMALYEVGEAYLRGIGVKRNKQEAMKYLKMAAENGDTDAMKLINSEENHPILNNVLNSLASPARKILNHHYTKN